jgi:NAD(P)H dehydrogenase (quinone)
MTTYGITGATGKLGRLTISALLDQGVPGASIVALARSTPRAADLASSGIQVRAADYDQPQTLPAALEGVDVLLLISAPQVGKRLPQHRAVIDAAAAVGVQRIAYTSVLHADTTDLVLAPDHAATEQLLRDSGLSTTVLRNGWYIENYTDKLPQYLASGEILNATDGGRVAAATRADYAQAAAVTLTGAGHEGRVYELGGPAFTMAELAATITHVTGTNVASHDVSAPELQAALEATGIPAATAAFVSALDQATARGELDTDPAALSELIRRPTTTLETALRATA